MRDARAGSGAPLASPEASIRTVRSPTSAMPAPRPRTASSRVSTSPIWGRLSRTTGPDTSSDAAITGRASFLLPAGRSAPWMGRPPSTVN